MSTKQAKAVLVKSAQPKRVLDRAKAARRSAIRRFIKDGNVARLQKALGGISIGGCMQLVGSSFVKTTRTGRKKR